MKAYELFEMFGDKMEIDGFVLHQDEELEEDNRKIFHDIVTPDGKRHLIHHTPYEWIGRDVFVKYIEWYKKNGRFPNYGEIRPRGNADRESMLALKM